MIFFIRSLWNRLTAHEIRLITRTHPNVHIVFSSCFGYPAAGEYFIGIGINQEFGHHNMPNVADLLLIYAKKGP
jgi:hypothetical protein